MIRKTLLFSAFLVALLSGAVTPVAQNISPEMQKLIDVRDDQRCQKLGALPNTEPYITCRLKLQEMAQTQWAAQNMQLQQQRMNEQAVNNQPIFFPGFKPFHLPPPRHFEVPKRTNCTSQVIGDQLQTNCQEQ